MLKIRVSVLRMVPRGNLGMLIPNLGSELPFRARKLPLEWHVTIHVPETRVDVIAAF